MSDKFIPKIPSSEFVTNASPAIVQEHASGWVSWRVTAKVVAAASANVTVFACPANSVITGFALAAQGVGADPIATGTHLGLGVSGTLNKFDEVAEASVDASDIYVDPGLPATGVWQATAANVLLASTNGSGTAAGNFTGTWHAVVTGKTFVGFGA